MGNSVMEAGLLPGIVFMIQMQNYAKGGSCEELSHPTVSHTWHYSDTVDPPAQAFQFFSCQGWIPLPISTASDWNPVPSKIHRVALTCDTLPAQKLYQFASASIFNQRRWSLSSLLPWTLRSNSTSSFSIQFRLMTEFATQAQALTSLLFFVGHY